MVVVMVGDEVTAIVTMAGAVAGRWGGEVITVRQVTGRKAGANTVPVDWQERRREAMKWMLVVLVSGVTPVSTNLVFDKFSECLAAEEQMRQHYLDAFDAWDRSAAGQCRTAAGLQEGAGHAS